MEKGNGIGMGKGSGNWSEDCQSTGIDHPKVLATPLVHFIDIILHGSLGQSAFFALKTEAEHAKLA